jgi:NAD(P)-dependent dehydrogenase (short-subunit alcohol dehydrogenase family)
MLLFSIPVLAPLFLRLALSIPALRRNAVDNIPDEKIHHSPKLASDAARSVKTYPANYFRSFSRRRPVPVIDTPVQLIVNTKDKYVRPYGFDDTARWVPRLWRRDIKAGHFSPMSHPQVMAAAVHDFADLAEGKRPSRAMLRAQVGRPRERFGDTLVSVTGAGSGIGRETAYAFAREGAELVLSDIDEATVKETAAEIAARGGVAHPYVLDVSGADAVEAFAERVSAEHGVPDIVVNNAGIGAAGGFLDTPAEDFDRVLEINLGGVVNGCRSFGRRLVERGTGGYIVNVASMAAFSPMQSLSAYCTSKAAAFMLSDCLRAEFDAADVGVTTICPGVINTNIISTTRFSAPAGKIDKVDDRRGQITKLFALRHYGPDNVANAILSSVTKKKPIRPVAPEAYAFYGLARVAPQALRSLARFKVI